MVPKVSVIIPVYNGENFIEETIDSVKNQTMKNIEIIVLNDGSTDNSLSILKNYKENDSRFVLVDNENRGYIYLINYAVSIAKSDYIMVLDHDDMLELCALEEMHKIAKNLDSDIVACGTIRRKNKNIFYPEKCNDSIKMYLTRKIQGDIWAKLINRNFFLKVEPNLKRVAFDLIQNTRKISIVKKPYHIYNETNSSSTTKDLAFVQNWLVQYLDQLRAGIKKYEKYEKYYLYYCFSSFTHYMLQHKDNLDELVAIFPKLAIVNRKNINFIKAQYCYTYIRFLGALFSQKGATKVAFKKLGEDMFSIKDVQAVRSYKKNDKNRHYSLKLFLYYVLKTSRHTGSINIFGTGFLLKETLKICKKEKIEVKNIINSYADTQDIVKSSFKVKTLAQAYSKDTNVPILIISYTYHKEISRSIKNFSKKSKIDIKILNKNMK